MLLAASFAAQVLDLKRASLGDLCVPKNGNFIFVLELFFTQAKPGLGLITKGWLVGGKFKSSTTTTMRIARYNSYGQQYKAKVAGDHLSAP